MPEYYLTLRHSKNPSEKREQSNIRCTFYRRGGKFDFQGIAVRADDFSTPCTGLYVQSENQAFPGIIAAIPFVA